MININNLQFGYEVNTPILKSLNLSVPKASIYGFLGANGAGKTTTIRMILGLLKAEAGEITVFGAPIQKQRTKILANIGSLIEEPSIYLHLNGYDNLKIACKYLNIPNKKIEEVLEIVQLTTHSKKITKQYSTGMKQRLGLAIALLRDPDLLILDEPINGLDPTGIIEIRSIIQHLHQQGKTIFLSSHLLSEVEKIATHVGILQNGQMLFQGTLDKLNQLKQNNLHVHIRSATSDRVAALLKTQYTLSVLPNDTVAIDISDERQIPTIIEILVAHKVKIYEVAMQQNDLEETFINMTAKNFPTK